MTAWPATLPSPGQALLEALEAGHDESVIRSEVASGLPKARRLYSTRRLVFPVALGLTGAQAKILETFYESTVKAVLPFDFDHPITDATISARFVTAPAYAGRAGGDSDGRIWIARFSLERIP